MNMSLSEDYCGSPETSSYSKQSPIKTMWNYLSNKNPVKLVADVPKIRLSPVPVSVSSVLNPKAVTLSISSPVTVMSPIPSNFTVVSSTDSNVLSSEESTPVSKNPFSQVSINNYPKIQDSSVTLNTNLKLADMLTQYIKQPEKVDDLSINLMNNDVIHQSNVSNNVIETVPVTIVTQSPQYIETISTTKHIHSNGICLKAPNSLIDTKKLSQMTVLLQSKHC